MTTPRLPDFIVIGARRSGTTSLFRWLADNPSIGVPGSKELHYFDTDRFGDHDWYAGQFRLPEPVVGEATPRYLVTSAAPTRIAALVPRVRLIAALRHPVDRAVSTYWMEFERGREHRPLQQALSEDLDATDHGYLWESRYVEHLARFRRHFPAEQLLVLYTDELECQPRRAYERACEFLAVAPDPVPASVGERANGYRTIHSLRVRSLARRLPSVAARAVGRLNSRTATYPVPSDDLRARLVDHFAIPNRQLQELVGSPVPVAWGS